MPIYTKDDRSLLFVHVPKTGGTTLEKMLVASGWQEDMKVTPLSHPEQFRFYRCTPQHYHAPMLRQAFRVPEFDEVFLITRDPLARFRSEYAMRNKRGDGSAEHVEEWTRRVLERYQDNPFIHDNHLRPQHEFVLPRARIFRLEDGMDSIVSTLNREWDLGLPTEVPQHMSSGTQGRISSGAVQVNAYVERRVREFYAVDYERFGYA